MEPEVNELKQLRGRVRELEAQLEEKRDLEQALQTALHDLHVHQEELRTQNDELRAAQKEIEASHKKYVDLFDFAPVGYLSLDPNGVIQEINLTGARMLDRSRNRLTGKPLRLYVEAASRDLLSAHLREVASGNRSSIEIELVTPDGGITPAAFETIPVTDRWNRVVSLRTAMTDLSEKKAAEEEKQRLEKRLRQAEKMEAIGTLAGGIAHDFNNILSVILGYGELLDSDLPDGSQGKPEIQEILQAGFRARDLVTQILSFSRQSEQKRLPIRIDRTIKETLKLLRSILPTDIEIQQNLNLPPGRETIAADPTQIHQVVMNLATNAAHAMRERGGVLEVDLNHAQLSEEAAHRHHGLPPGDYVELTVTDTGGGIDPHIINRIFDPYFTTKAVGEGTGMGLALVHGIVKNHAGIIKVHNDPGKGAFFEILLPCVEDRFKTKTAPRTPLPRGRECILFVDDEPALARLGKKMLETLGYEVTAQTSSVDALALFKQQPDRFDLVITDTTMPHMTGDVLARELMKIRPDLPIVICTGYSNRISKETAAEIGIQAFAMKPLFIRDLAETVRRVLAHHGEIPPQGVKEEV